MKLLWLDDVRDPMTNDWLVFSPIPKTDITEVIWVYSYQEFVYWIEKNGLPDGICFDHDLVMNVALKARDMGMSKRKSRQLKQYENTGFDCAKWLINYCIDNNKPLPLYNIQSANPVGKANIDGLLKNFIRSTK